MLCDGATTVIKTYLRNVDVGLLGSHEVGLVAPMPLDQEVQFPGLLRGSEDLLRLQSSGKSSRLVSPFRLLSWSINNWLSLINQHTLGVIKICSLVFRELLSLGCTYVQNLCGHHQEELMAIPKHPQLVKFG